MQPREVISRTREGIPLSETELEAWLNGYLKRDIPDYQMSAWLMAVFFRGLTAAETSVLTRSLWKSGITFPRATNDDYWIDKHSTGGVGDKTSLLLVPILTVMANEHLGQGKVRIPMISGRALGHSGGTLDKLESVPGFSPAISVKRAEALLKENQFFMMGQTDDLAPLDRLLYALRDVTATVESRPLIVSSIMSKKLAENLNGLVIDVKFGRGAFMKTREDAKALALALVDVAKKQGKDSAAVLTRMDEPLGNFVGNSLEVLECWNYLTGKAREAGLHEVTKELAAWMYHFASRRTVDLKSARDIYEETLREHSSVLQATYKKMFSAQGGDFDRFLSERDAKARELKVATWIAPANGYLERMDAYHLGVLLNRLGGGRMKKEDRIDEEVGIEVCGRVGQSVEKGQLLARIFYRRSEDLAVVESFEKSVVSVSQSAVDGEAGWIEDVV